jgi:hypothetical protein
MTVDFAVEEQIARLLNRGSGRVWELTTEPRAGKPKNVLIRDAAGNVVLYARPAAA